MHQQISKRIIIYFFLFIFLGTVNNFNFSKFYNFKVHEIKVNGLDDIQNLEISKKLEILKLNDLFFIDRIVIDKIMSSNNLIEKYFVFKIYPQTLEIKIKKTDFLANVIKNGVNFFIGSNGNLIETNQTNSNLPFIFGSFDIKEFLNFKNTIDKSDIEYNKIEKIYFFDSGRWDIKMKEGTLIKLPISKVTKALDFSAKILLEKKFSKTTLIDLRIENQVIINE